MRGANVTLETINAAATAIAFSENNRTPPPSAQKRRWVSCWRAYWCFGSHKQAKRIGNAVLVPEITASGGAVPTSDNPNQAPPPVMLPFAPPSSPASLLQSEPPSATQSPAGLLSLTSTSASMYSPGGPASIFAIGPYAHETQLVSPPVFSTFTTEPSTAPFTPPPESVHLTTPSSPEVPFAMLLDPNHQNGVAGQGFPLSHYEFQSYQLHPGSPVGQLISPSSGISGSGSSSPFPDRDFAPGHLHSLEFQTGNSPKNFGLDKLFFHEWGSQKGSGTLTSNALGLKPRDRFLLDSQNSDTARPASSANGWRNDESVVDHRVSFEITAEEVVRCVEKKPATFSMTVLASLENAGHPAEDEENCNDMANNHKCQVCEKCNISEKGSENREAGLQHQKQRAITLGSVKEFNFDNADGGNSDRPSVSSDWWSNEKVVGKESGECKNWSFFPMMQPGVS